MEAGIIRFILSESTFYCREIAEQEITPISSQAFCYGYYTILLQLKANLLYCRNGRLPIPQPTVSTIVILG